MTGDTITSKVVLCKDCKHHYLRDCLRQPQGDYIDVVTGKRRKAIYPYCSNERKYEVGNCGPEAKYFEPKRKWWVLW